jgi:hypothetical protein
MILDIPMSVNYQSFSLKLSVLVRVPQQIAPQITLKNHPIFYVVVIFAKGVELRAKSFFDIIFCHRHCKVYVFKIRVHLNKEEENFFCF